MEKRTKLDFREEAGRRGPSKLTFAADERPAGEEEKTPSGAATETAVTGIYVAGATKQTQKARPDEESGRDAEAVAREPAGYRSNEQSRRQQKRSVKKRYTENAKTAEKTAKGAKRTAEETKKGSGFVRKHGKVLLAVGAASFVLFLVLSAASSCSLMFEGVSNAVASSTFPAEDGDMISAEEAYAGMEDRMREFIASYEAAHSVDEVVFRTDPVGHDPYELIAAISALSDGSWSAGEIGDDLRLLFDSQYTLTESVRVETRYRTESRTGTVWIREPSGGTYYPVTTEYRVEVPVEYRIATVVLTNAGLGRAAADVLSEEQRFRYDLYMETLGNRPDLFPEAAAVH